MNIYQGIFFQSLSGNLDLSLQNNQNKKTSKIHFAFKIGILKALNVVSL